MSRSSLPLATPVIGLLTAGHLAEILKLIVADLLLEELLVGGIHIIFFSKWGGIIYIEQGTAMSGDLEAFMTRHFESRHRFTICRREGSQTNNRRDVGTWLSADDMTSVRPVTNRSFLSTTCQFSNLHVRPSSYNILLVMVRMKPGIYLTGTNVPSPGGILDGTDEAYSSENPPSDTYSSSEVGGKSESGSRIDRRRAHPNSITPTLAWMRRLEESYTISPAVAHAGLWRGPPVSDREREKEGGGLRAHRSAAREKDGAAAPRGDRTGGPDLPKGRSDGGAGPRGRGARARRETAATMAPAARRSHGGGAHAAAAQSDDRRRRRAAARGEEGEKKGGDASPRVAGAEEGDGGRRRQATGGRRRLADELRRALRKEKIGIREREMDHGDRDPWPKAAVEVALTRARGDEGSGDEPRRRRGGRGGPRPREANGGDGVRRRRA
uniref:XS domain containing protein-like n=2 Tax=Oryza sativa subsp. japonica TaxID=39947 RepID=Q67UY5_ORYSJ|nr:XS domain containing protein-like [Oryza sativa Japonica Group]